MKVSRWSMQISDPTINKQMKNVLEKSVVKFIPLIIMFYTLFTGLYFYHLINGKPLAKYYLIRNASGLCMSTIFYLTAKRWTWTVDLLAGLTFV